MSLPTRIKVNIRDLWDKPESEVQTSIIQLKSLIGHDVLIEPEWPLLWTEMQKHYPELSTFVPAIASTTVAWCASLSEIAEDEHNEEWTEILLEKLKAVHVLKVLFNVSDGRPTTRWAEKYNAFEICFPKSQAPNHATMVAGFHSDMRTAFPPPKPALAIPDRARGRDRSTSDEDSFTEVYGSECDTASILTPTTTDRYAQHRSQHLDTLPTVSMIERPEELMKKPPYHLIVTHAQYGKMITLQCSHQPTLEVISEYFQRWVKRNHNQSTKPPAADICMKESCFGLGLLYDRLEFQSNDYDHKHGLSPTLILTFVENVLGYRMTWNDASSWTFRRDTAFKS